MAQYRETLTFDVEAAEWTGRNSADIAAIVEQPVTVDADGILSFADLSNPPSDTPVAPMTVKQGEVVVRYLTGNAGIKVISKDEFHRSFTRARPKTKAATAASTPTS